MAWLTLLALLNLDPLARVGCDPIAKRERDGALEVECMDGRALHLTRPPSCDEPLACTLVPNACITIR